MKRSQTSTTTNLIIVVILIVVLLIVFGRPLYAKSRDVINDVGSRLGITTPKPIVEQQPQGPLRDGFISTYKASAGGTTIPILALDPKLESEQMQSNEFILDKSFVKITALPILIYFDQPVSRSSKSIILPNIRLQYCAKTTGMTVGGTASLCKIIEYKEYCASFESCDQDYKLGVLNITQLPGPGWYQLDIQPDGIELYGETSKKWLPFNSNTAVMKFEYRP